MLAQINAPYPNRIQLELAPYTGPFTQSGPLGSFDPARDLQIFINGVLTSVQTSSFDGTNNRYLIYMSQAFVQPQVVVQVIHHMVNPPFEDANSISLRGFAIIAGYSTIADTPIPQIALSAIPTTVSDSNNVITPNSITLLWSTIDVAQIRITGTDGFDSGLLVTIGSVIIPMNLSASPPLTPQTIILTMTGYNANGSPILVGSPAIELQVTATVTILSANNYLLQENGTFRFILEDGSGFILLE